MEGGQVEGAEDGGATPMVGQATPLMGGATPMHGMYYVTTRYGMVESMMSYFD